jgi:hypothetical protein
MSFSLTTPQIRAKTKTVTRRIGWYFLKAGDVLNAVEKCRGLKKGEKVKRICQIRVVSVRNEALYDITKEDCIKEGFPDMEPSDFSAMFARHNNFGLGAEVTRIEFEYL